MELNEQSLKHALVEHFKKLNFNGGTNHILNYIQMLENKSQNDATRQNLNYLRIAIRQCSSESLNEAQKMRGFNEMGSFVEYTLSPFIYNINDVELLIHLLSFFDNTFIYVQELKNLTARNSSLTQENVILTNELKNVLADMKKMKSQIENLIGANSPTHDGPSLIIKEIKHEK